MPVMKMTAKEYGEPERQILQSDDKEDKNKEDIKQGVPVLT